MLNNKIVYIFSAKLRDFCNQLPPIRNRASVVQDLIQSYELLSRPNVVVVESQDATELDLKSFHSSAYIDFLKSVNASDSSLEQIGDYHLEYGLGYDCPIIDNMYDFARCIAGGSLSAAKLLTFQKCQIVINWFGGWHHAQRDSAAGFCYINDIVIAIQYMSKVFKRILYIDLDIHHGDGVQNAFEYSNKIVTLSFHKYSPGFFPGTGNLDDIGSGNGKYHSMNVPFSENTSDETFIKVFNEIVPLVLDSFKPQAIVIQCGADGLNGDKLGESNLTLKSFSNCVQTILQRNLPTLFLGGGGYNIPNTARLWTYLTSIIAGHNIDNDIPESCRYFGDYGPSFELDIEAGRRKDNNTEEHLKTIIDKIKSCCQRISK